MPAYVVVDVDIKDMETYKEYRDKAPATIAKYGGKYLVRAPAIEHVEPGWDLHRFVILEFPTVEQFRTWYRSPEYSAILPIRLKATQSRMCVVEGLAPGAPLPQ